MITLRLSKNLHFKLAKYCDRKDTSINKLLIELVEAELQKESVLTTVSPS